MFCLEKTESRSSTWLVKFIQASPPVTSATKVVVLLVLINCILLLPLLCGGLVSSFTISSIWRRELVGT